MVLGQSRGKEVRVMVHHSRNSEQKQWDETVVIALGGMARLLRAHLPAIVGMDRVAGGAAWQGGWAMGWRQLCSVLSSNCCADARQARHSHLPSMKLPYTTPSRTPSHPSRSRLGGDDGCGGVQHGWRPQGGGTGRHCAAVGGSGGARLHHRHCHAGDVEALCARSGRGRGGSYQPRLHGAAHGELR